MSALPRRVEMLEIETQDIKEAIISMAHGQEKMADAITILAQSQNESITTKETFGRVFNEIEKLQDKKADKSTIQTVFQFVCVTAGACWAIFEFIRN